MDEGRRERKKRESRRHIADVATGLFVRHGFEQVTIAEVAEAAEVSKKTVSNYFARKEDLFFDRQEDILRAISDALRARPDGEPVSAALRRYQHRLLAERHPTSGVFAGIDGFLWVIRQSPALTARALELDHEIEDLIREVLLEEGADRAHARIVAGLLSSALTSISKHSQQRILDGDDLQDVQRAHPAVIDAAFDLVEGGIAR
ncbi:TetR/AcrR family transcriptional regulator [Amycolatopsis minnesotensis]|uniref:TetR/AcrR family transcriptional regulator n=1 Tax=Amycolatopsis minnesotensis TaxID=337894 RepID=A0ABN2SQ29_9PSEU